MIDKNVKKHDGVIRLTSRGAHGTEFSKFIPIQYHDAQPMRDPAKRTLPHGTAHILVVADEPIIRDASKFIVEGLGDTVCIAENGEEGLSIFKGHKDSITPVIADFTWIPSGHELLHAYRNPQGN